MAHTAVTMQSKHENASNGKKTNALPPMREKCTHKTIEHSQDKLLFIRKDGTITIQTCDDKEVMLDILLTPEVILTSDIYVR